MRLTVVTPQTILRIEGAATLVVVLAAYLTLDGSLLLLAGLALAPDLSMAGYLAGPRIGSRVYNTAHTYTLPLALGGGGWWLDARLPLLVALVWAGHIGADRLFGYGLKFESGFRDTHLASQPAPHGALTDGD